MTERPDPSIIRLEIAQPPVKERLLEALNELRDEIERGEIVALVTITFRAEESFFVSSFGDIRLATLAGVLGRAQLDALEAMVKKP